MKHFNKEELYKIQAVLDLFATDHFRFEINGKTLETLIFGGGMGMDTSTEDIAFAFGRTGSAGTIALSKSRHKERYAKLDIRGNDFIIGTNTLVSLSDFRENFELSLKMGADFKAAGAGVDRLVMESIKEQKQYFGEDHHHWMVPLFSAVSQSKGHIKRNSGIMILENDEAGGHNGKGLDTKKTIEEYRSVEIDKKGNKIVFAGGIRTPYDGVKALDAGFDAIQIASMSILAEEAHVQDYYRRLIIDAKPGDVQNVPSPAGLPGKAFVNAGIMKRILKGESLRKLPCADTPEGCLKNCTLIEQSAKLAGVEVFGDYCIEAALYQLHPEDGPNIYKKDGVDGALYFCGARPEDIFIIPYMKEHNLTSLPLNVILGKFVAGMYDSVIAGDGLTEHKGFLEEKLKAYNATKPEELSGKLPTELIKEAA